MSATCETCRFWDGVAGIQRADCRRNAPIFPSSPYALGREWPHTYPTDFCGEHQPKDQPHDQN